MGGHGEFSYLVYLYIFLSLCIFIRNVTTQCFIAVWQVDLFFYRDPEEAKEHEEEEQPAATIEYPAAEYTASADFPAAGGHEWATADTNWAAEAPVPTETTWAPATGQSLILIVYFFVLLTVFKLKQFDRDPNLYHDLHSLIWYVLLLKWTAPVEGGWDPVAAPPQVADIASAPVVATGWEQQAPPPNGASWE